MNQRLSEYFANEAGDYLDRLDNLLSAPGRPDATHLLRLSRGVRGSAQMAGAETIATVAGRLEDAIRSVTSNNIVWSEAIRRLAQQTVDDLRILLRALNRWGPEEERRMRQAIGRWDDMDSGGSGAGPAAPPPVLPISALFYEHAGPHLVPSPSGGAFTGGPAVPIECLLLSGEAALGAALSLRPRIEALVREPGADPARLRAFLEELFDLVQQGITPSPPTP